MRSYKGFIGIVFVITGLLWFGTKFSLEAGSVKSPGKKVLRQAWQVIQESLTNNDSKIREEAVKALAYIDNKYAVNSLVSSLEDESDYVKIWAAQSLAKKGSSAGKDALLSILLSNGDKGADKAGSLGALMKLKALARGRVRGEAAKVLGTIGDRDLIPVLKRTKRDSDGRVRDGAAIALARMGDKSETIVFASALKDSDKGIRLAAVEALAAIADPSTVKPLLPLLADEEEDIRNVTARALGSIKAREAAEPLSRRLTDPSGLVRESSAWALGEIGEPKKIPYVKASLSDPNVFVKLSAAIALGKMNDHAGLASCEEALSSNDLDARFIAARALGFILSRNSQSLAIKTLNDGNQKVRLGAAISIFRFHEESKRN